MEQLPLLSVLLSARMRIAALVFLCCGILKEECIHVEHDFGFFGEKDGESERFDLCAACYEKLTAHFCVPVESRERKELL